MTAADYEDNIATDDRIDRLRDKISISESHQFTKDYLDPDKRSISNALAIELDDGTILEEVVIEYPIGHKRRREEGTPQLIKKFKINLARRFLVKQQRNILNASLDYNIFANTPVDEFVDLMLT